jgi:alkylhydroperoxidase family enzyme
VQSPRIEPVPAEPADPELRQELLRWMPPGAGVEPLLLFRSLAAHPSLMQAMRPLGSFILGRRSRLALRTRELLIDRVCARSGCEYEWGVHVQGFGAAAGIDAATAEATLGADAADPRWTPAEQALLAAVDALCAGPALDDDRWRALALHYDAAQCLEILVAVGWYRLISGICIGLALPPEPWAARFPRGAEAGDRPAHSSLSAAATRRMPASISRSESDA